MLEGQGQTPRAGKPVFFLKEHRSGRQTDWRPFLCDRKSPVPVAWGQGHGAALPGGLVLRALGAGAS